jgi:hypothetical protein
MTFYVMIITDVEVLVGSSKAVGTVHDITGSNALISDAPSARYLYRYFKVHYAEFICSPPCIPFDFLQCL